MCIFSQPVAEVGATKIEKSRGLVDPALPVFRMQILGEMENADIVPRL